MIVLLSEQIETAFIQACNDNAHLKDDVQMTKIAVVQQFHHFYAPFSGLFDAEILHSVAHNHFALLLRYWFMVDPQQVFEVLHDFDAICLRMSANTEPI